MNSEILLLKFNGCEYAKVLKFSCRWFECVLDSGEVVKAHYPYVDPKILPYPGCGVIVKGYEVPKAFCSHFVVSGDLRVFRDSKIDLNYECWNGYNPLFNNKLFESVLNKNLWPFPHSVVNKQVGLEGARIDFLIDNCYVQVKSISILNKHSPRAHKHFTILSKYPKSKIVIMVPESTPHVEDEKINRVIDLAKIYPNLEFFILRTFADREGGFWYKSLEKV